MEARDLMAAATTGPAAAPTDGGERALPEPAGGAMTRVSSFTCRDVDYSQYPAWLHDRYYATLLPLGRACRKAKEQVTE